VFGRVTGGMEVVETIGSAATDAQDRPLDEVRIEAVRVDD
jgi:cyclophilin family peptidyl-prolyl cis-trans isomerase